MSTTTTTTQQGGLSSWAQPYIANYLGKAQALGDTDYSVYQGPLTAGPSTGQSMAAGAMAGMQTGQFFQPAMDAYQGALGGIAGLPAYTPTEFNPGTFTSQMAQQYMNPYLQQALDPQLAEARRQSDISRMQDESRMTQAGSYGGSRQAILNAERDRNLQRNLSNITGVGYATAYDKAAQQFNTEQGRTFDAYRAGEQSRQFGATDDLARMTAGLTGAGQLGNLASQQQRAEFDRINALFGMGNEQRKIEQEGITADYNEFLRQADFDYNQVNFMRDALSGLPVSAISNTSQDPSVMNSIIGAILAAQGLSKAAGGRVQLARGGTVPGGIAGLAISRMG